MNGFEPEVFHILITLLGMVTLVVITQVKQRIERINRRQKGVIDILIEIARKDAELWSRLSERITKILVMNGD
jgi:hypothetical protein